MNLWLLRRKLHVSWLIAVFSLGIVMGVMLAARVPSGWFYSAVWLLLGLMLLVTGIWRGRVYAIVLVLLGGTIVGLWRGSIDQAALAPYKNLIGAQVGVAGTVSEDADIGSNHELILRLKNIAIEGHNMPGSLWVSLSDTADIKRGDRVSMQGRLSNGFGSFSASIYRAKLQKVQRPEPGDVARRARDWFGDQVRRVIPEPEVSLGLGYLLGQRRALPPELIDALKIAGLTHVIVASGYNLTILVRLARRLFVKVSKYLATLSAAAMIVSFVMITGISPSMSRAGLVAGLSLLAWYYGRKFHPLVLLPFAAAITLLINPSYGWNDLGWQLSFTAFAGVMILAPLLQAYFFGEAKPSIFRQILGETLCAQIATLPILVLAFGQFSNVALLANILILPLVPLAMLLVFLSGTMTMIVPAVAVALGNVTTWLLHYMIVVAQYMAGLSWAQSTLSITGWLVGGYYACLALVCVYLWRTTHYSLRDSNIVE